MRGAVSTAIVFAIVVIVAVVIVIVIDLSCYFLNGCGVTMLICVHVCGKGQQKDVESDEEAEER